MSDLIFFKVTHSEIQDLDLKRLLEVLDVCIELNSDGELELNTLLLSTDAYDNDPRALFDIPEMRKWCEIVGTDAAQIFLYLASDSVNWFFPALAPIEVTKRTPTKTDYRFVQPETDLLLNRLRGSIKAFLKGVTSGNAELERIWSKCCLNAIRAQIN